MPTISAFERRASRARRAGRRRAPLAVVAAYSIAADLLAGAGIAAAAPLEIAPGPMLWTMPSVEKDGVGTADFLADRDYGLCSSCESCELEALMVAFASPGPLGRISGCGTVVQDSLVETTRLETITLQSIGSTATVAVSLRTVVFTRGGLAVQPIFYCRAGTRVSSARLFASAGTMTVRRTSETGGSFDLRFDVFLDVTFAWSSLLAARLGPYSVAMENVGWRHRVAASPLCQACVGDFSVDLSGVSGEQFVLRGSGTAGQPGSPIQLDDSRFAMPLLPVCAVRTTAVHEASWSAIKGLFK